MAEGTTLVKAIAAIGIIALMAALLFPDSGVPAFNNLSAGLPTFNNPFAAKSYTFTIAKDNYSYAPLYSPLSVRGYKANQPSYCQAHESPVPNSWYGCLNSPDQNASYLTTGFGGFSQGIDVNLGGFPDTSGTWRVISVSVTFQCKGFGTGIQFSFQKDPEPPFSHLGDAVDGSSCHLIGTSANDDTNQAPGYTNKTLTIDTTLDGVYMTGARGFSGALMRIENGGAIGPSSDLFTVSYVSVTVTYQRESGCHFETSGNPWDDVSRATYYVGCVLLAFVQLFLDFITFLINIVVYIFGWLIFVGTFFADMAAVLVWLYAIPGMPTFAQAFIDVMLTALIGYLVITTLKLIRGSDV